MNSEQEKIFDDLEVEVRKNAADQLRSLRLVNGSFADWFSYGFIQGHTTATLVAIEQIRKTSATQISMIEDNMRQFEHVVRRLEEVEQFLILSRQISCFDIHEGGFRRDVDEYLAKYYGDRK